MLESRAFWGQGIAKDFIFNERFSDKAFSGIVTSLMTKDKNLMLSLFKVFTSQNITFSRNNPQCRKLDQAAQEHIITIVQCAVTKFLAKDNNCRYRR